jgi:hypothetical protein
MRRGKNGGGVLGTTEHQREIMGNNKAEGTHWALAAGDLANGYLLASIIEHSTGES